MSKVVSIRLPDKLYFQLKNSARPIKDQIILALNRYFFFENQAVTPVIEEKISLSHEDLVLILDELFRLRWGGSS